MVTIGFIGVGNMGGALALAASKVKGNKVLVSDKDDARAASVAKKLRAEKTTDLEICKRADFIFFGVKPQVIHSLLDELKDVFAAREDRFVLVSMAAGISMEQIEAHFDKKVPVVRIMPNMPVMAGEGMIVYTCNAEATMLDTDILTKAMSAAGKWDFIGEGLVDAASAVSGCGPAFVFMFIDALADGAVSCGLSRERALQYVAQTVLGSAKLILNGEHPQQMKDAVCSPAGSTIEGVKVLENASFRAGVINAVTTSFERTKELGKQK